MFKLALLLQNMGTKKALTTGSTVIQIVGILVAGGTSSDVDTIWQYDTDKLKVGISKDGKVVKAWTGSASCEATSTES